MITDLDKILKEWAYRVDDGKPNPSKSTHLYHLSEILNEYKWPFEVIDEFIQNLNEGDEWWTKLSPEQQAQYIKDHPKSQKAQDAKEKEKGEEPKDKKSKKETASEKKKRREQENIKTDNTIKNSDNDNVVVDLVKNRRKEIYDTKDLPAGTPGSTLGETSGGEAFEQLTKNPDLTEEEFVESEHNKLKGTPLYKELEAKAKATKPPSAPKKYVKSWLKVGYKTGKGELEYLESETKFKYKKPQDSPYPIGTIMDYNQKQIVQSLLQKKLKEAKTEEERQHYKKQLDYVEKLDDTDTGILYETTDGVIGFKHTSNKKNWNDPHNNTSVRKKGEKINNFVDKLKLSDEDKQSVKKSTTEAIEKAANIVDNAEQVVEDDTKNLSDSAIEKTSKLLSILEPNTKNYVEQIRTASSIKKMFENEGEDLENATELELTKAVVDLIKKGNAPQDIKKIILKTSDIVSRIRKLNKDGLKQYGGPMNESQIAKHLNIDVNLVREALSSELDSIVDTSRKRKDSMSVAHESVVTDLQEADSQMDTDSYPNNPKGDNGPNQRAYVQSFLEEIHFSRYISGELEGVQSINIGGTAVKPNHFRSCLGELSGFKSDPETREGKEQLMEHLRRRIRVSPTSNSISFSNKEGSEDIEVGQETYRTKGNSKSILCQLGKDLQSCLKEKVS